MNPQATPGRATFCVALLAFLALAVRLGNATETRAQATPPPNVVVIVSDDQPTGMVKRMPVLDRAAGFARFNSYYDNNPLCCPTRATLLTGLYSHHTGVETNLDAPDFDDSSTLATWLDEAGYETGLFGKYLNNYPVGPRCELRSAGLGPVVGVHAGRVLLRLHAGRRPDAPRTTGTRPRDYSTDVLADQVDEFIATGRATSRSSPTSLRTRRTRRGPRRRAIVTRSRTLA